MMRVDVICVVALVDDFVGDGVVVSSVCVLYAIAVVDGVVDDDVSVW